jgi:carotenoid cleavage dioxygenase-like enzyme
MHSFGMSNEYLILVETPFVVSPLELLTSSKSFIENFTWKPKQGTTFFIVDKESGDIKAKINTKNAGIAPFFFMHIANSYQEQNRLIMDIVCYDDSALIWDFSFTNLLSPNRAFAHGTLKRISFDLEKLSSRASKNSVTIETLFDIPYESPTLSPKLIGKKNRILFGLSSHSSAVLADSIVALDLIDKKVLWEWKMNNEFPTAPVFVASPDGVGEQDGVILSSVLDGESGNSYILILDAHTGTEQARVKLAQHIPFSMHALYWDHKSLSRNSKFVENTNLLL